jgi:protein O-mannosyl-transferase
VRVMTGYRLEIGIAVCLALVTLGVFWHAVANGFVNVDDHRYVFENPYVQDGLTAASVCWAFTTFETSNWHPLTWLSLEADAQLSGTGPRGFHRTNVLLHAANAVLLFVALRCLTGRVWPAGLVAALFALHPLHVESVAWVSERKDVLSTFFWMLALIAYAWYVRRPGWRRYFAVVTALVLGLLAKPMLVSLPFVLLLLDYWPLRRSGMRRLVWEKAPLFVVAAASCVVTYYAQSHGAIQSFSDFSLAARAANAVVAYATYLRKMVWPHDLAAFYPHPRDGLPPWQIAAAAVLLAAISGCVLALARRQPYLLVGWLWYLGTLVPVIGLVQVGVQGMADRYTYVPLIGCFLMVAWGLADLAVWGRSQIALPALGGVALIGCAVLSWLQVTYWRNSIRLWEHTLQVTTRNAFAHQNLGAAFVEEGKEAEAMRQFEACLQADPRNGSAHHSLGVLLANAGRGEEAIQHLQTAIELIPRYWMAHTSLGALLARQGKLEEADQQFARACQINPNNPEAYDQWGTVLVRLGRLDEAVTRYRRAIQLAPEVVQYHCDLALALHRQGNRGAADLQYQEALRLDPDWPETAIRRAWVAATRPEKSSRNGERAIRLAEQACQATGYKECPYLDTLAAAYAEVGRFEEAATVARKAIAAATAAHLPDVATEISRRLRLYEKRQPFRMQPGGKGEW